MAGKTGTAQVYTYRAGGPRGKGGPWRLRDHGLFVAFAPLDEPRYALAVIVQHGMGGSTAAAPRAREIMRVALLKDPELRARIEKPVPMPHFEPDLELDTVPDDPVFGEPPDAPMPASGDPLTPPTRGPA